MKFDMGDHVHAYFAGKQSTIVGEIVGVQTRDDGVYYTVSMTFESKPQVLTLILNELDLELTLNSQFDRVLRDL